MSWAEAKWVVDSLTQKTGQAPNKMRAFTANPLSSTSIGLKFLEPADSYDDAGNLVCAVGGVMIRMSTEGYPASTSDGTLVVNNSELGKYEKTTYKITGLTEGTTYYFSAFPYSDKGVYNVSGNNANHASAVAVAGEVARVTITIDDTADFASVPITCVDETDSTLTATQTLTAADTVATFAIPTGHSYHVEYGVEYGYSKPINTTSKTAVEGTASEHTGAYEYFSATITVTYPEGATLTCENDGVKYVAQTTTGSYVFTVHSLGVWTLTVTDGTDTQTTTASITENGQAATAEVYLAHVYGIRHLLSSRSAAWERTDESANFTATASIGTTAGHSDFDNCYPWSDMVRETLDTGDVMVKVPKFWYRKYRDSEYEYIQVSDKARTGFKLAKAFDRPTGKKAYNHIGAYKTITGHKSASGAKPLASLTRASFRTNAQKKGTGWGIVDIAIVAAVQILYLVEFANSNSQETIGRGYVDKTSSGASINTGSCDSVANLTGRASGTDGLTDVVYRGIEGFWGNVYEWTDGLNMLWASGGGTMYVSNDAESYKDDTASGYTALSFKTPSGSGYITEMGLDEEFSDLLLPSATGGAESTGYCDSAYYGSAAGSWYVLGRGGSWDGASHAGLFCTYLSNDSSDSRTDFGSRLLKIPS